MDEEGSLRIPLAVLAFMMSIISVIFLLKNESSAIGYIIMIVGCFFFLIASWGEWNLIIGSLSMLILAVIMAMDQLFDINNGLTLSIAFISLLGCAGFIDSCS